MTRAKIVATTALVLLANCGAACAGPLDAARDRFASACGDDLSRLCAVRRLGGDEAEVTCRPITTATAAPACVAAFGALRAARR